MIKSVKFRLRKCQKSLGFTLVEILMVTVVLIVITGLVVPNFAKTHLQLRFKETANHIAYVMRYAQQRAVSNNNQFRLGFSKNFKSYQLQELDSESQELSEKKYKHIQDRMGKLFEVPQKLKVESNLHFINFYPDGRIDKSRIYVCRNEECLTVSSQEQTGYVQVFEFKVEDEKKK